MLQHVGWCWIKFENVQIFRVTFLGVAWHCTCLATFVQHCCTGACALVRFAIWKNHPTCCNILQQGGQTCATCCGQQCCALLCLNVARVWPASSQLDPTMLCYLALKCCVRLAGPLQYIVGIIAHVDNLLLFYWMHQGIGLILSISQTLVPWCLGVWCQQ